MEKKRYKVRIKSESKIEELLQEIYEQAVHQEKEIQNEMNKLINSTNLAEVTIEEKSKYAKAMNDYFKNKAVAIALKFDVAKFMGEILKYNGDVNKALNDPNIGKVTKIDLASLRAELNKGDDDNTTYELKRK